MGQIAGRISSSASSRPPPLRGPRLGKRTSLAGLLQPSRSPARSSLSGMPGRGVTPRLSLTTWHSLKAQVGDALEGNGQRSIGSLVDATRGVPRTTHAKPGPHREIKKMAEDNFTLT